MDVMIPAGVKPSKDLSSFLDFWTIAGHHAIGMEHNPDSWPTGEEMLKLSLCKFLSMCGEQGWDKYRIARLRREARAAWLAASIEMSTVADRWRRNLEWWYDLPLSEIEWTRSFFKQEPQPRLGRIRGTLAARMN